MPPSEQDRAESCQSCSDFLLALQSIGTVLAVKLYRVALDESPRVPVLPCLDHEAMLHEGIAPHAAAYFEDDASGSIHEVVLIPAAQRIEIDVVSTMEEYTETSHHKLLAWLKTRFPSHGVRVAGPSWLRGDSRVARACRSQVTLREVLTSTALDEVCVRIERLRTIGGLMEKESRVASWSVRTVTGPLLAVAGFAVYQLLDAFIGQASPWLFWARYLVLGVLGAVFLYFGLKAVHLTEMANRVWKRTAEYSLIVEERRRALLKSGP